MQPGAGNLRAISPTVDDVIPALPVIRNIP